MCVVCVCVGGGVCVGVLLSMCAKKQCDTA